MDADWNAMASMSPFIGSMVEAANLSENVTLKLNEGQISTYTVKWLECDINFQQNIAIEE